MFLDVGGVQAQSQVRPGGPGGRLGRERPGVVFRRAGPAQVRERGEGRRHRRGGRVVDVPGGDAGPGDPGDSGGAWSPERFRRPRRHRRLRRPGRSSPAEASHFDIMNPCAVNGPYLLLYPAPYMVGLTNLGLGNTQTRNEKFSPHLSVPGGVFPTPTPKYVLLFTKIRLIFSQHFLKSLVKNKKSENR